MNSLTSLIPISCHWNFFFKFLIIFQRESFFFCPEHCVFRRQTKPNGWNWSILEKWEVGIFRVESCKIRSKIIFHIVMCKVFVENQIFQSSYLCKLMVQPFSICSNKDHRLKYQISTSSGCIIDYQIRNYGKNSIPQESWVQNWCWF